MANCQAYKDGLQGATYDQSVQNAEYVLLSQSSFILLKLLKPVTQFKYHAHDLDRYEYFTCKIMHLKFCANVNIRFETLVVH